MSSPKYKVHDRIVGNHGWDSKDRIITVTIVSANHGAVGAHRYWGQDDHGDAFGFYEDQIKGLDSKSLTDG